MIRIVRIAGRWRVTVGRLVVYSGRRFSAACAGFSISDATEGTTMAYLQIELTDTFGGESNYSWVRRATLPCSVVGDAEYMSRTYKRRMAKAARDALGYNGIPGRWEWYGDTAEFRPYGICHVMFVTWIDGPLTERETEQ